MYIFYIVDFKAIITCCFLPWFGFIGGAVISLISIGDKKKTIAICIETGIQNTAVAIFFLRLTFPQPESDIALANPILVSMATPIPFLKYEMCNRPVQNTPDKICPKFLQSVSATYPVGRHPTSFTINKHCPISRTSRKTVHTTTIIKNKFRQKHYYPVIKHLHFYPNRFQCHSSEKVPKQFV